MPAAATTATLIEYQRLPHGDRVDREHRVIRGVKVLGTDSGNSARSIGVDVDGTYFYSLDAMRAALPLYEGVRVYLDHPDFQIDDSGVRRRAPATRKTREHFGRLVNVRVEADGMYADLEYLSSHPQAEMVLEAAQRMPETLAMSHHAFGDPEMTEDGRVVITKINDVLSVDLISERPGTTNSLFESENPMTTNATSTNTSAANAANDNAAELAEMTTDPVDTLYDDSSTPADKVAAGFDAAINSVTADDGMDAGQKKDTISKLIDAKEQAINAINGESDQAANDTTNNSGGDGEAAANVAESQQQQQKLQERNQQLEMENARLLLENKGLLTDDMNDESKAALIKAFARSAPADRKVLIESIHNRTDGETILGPRPKQSKPLIESEAVEVPQDAKEFASVLRCI